MRKMTIIVLLAFAMILTACSNGGGSTPVNEGNKESSNVQNNNETNSGANVSEEPVEISIMSHFFGATPPRDDNEVELEIEKATNSKLKFQWNAAANYLDKLNVSMVSGELADLILIPNGQPQTNNVFVQAAQNEVFWDLTPYLDDYPNIKQNVPEVAWESNLIAGKSYYIPRPRPSESDYYFIFRKDWLDNLGLQVPTTDEELYEVMRAFTYDDPDQNGQDDTTGYVGIFWGETNSGDYNRFQEIFTGFNGEWKEENGQLTYYAFDPGVRESLDFLTKAYSEGLIAKDFPSMTTSQTLDFFAAGKAGMGANASGAMQSIYDVIVKNIPDFKLTDFVPATNINGYNPKGAGFNGGLAIPKKVPEDKMKKILAVLDTWNTEELFLMHSQGIEGIHYTVDSNGKLDIDSEKVTQDALGEYTQIVNVVDPYTLAYKANYPEDAKEIFKSIQDERAKTSVAPIVGLTSEQGKTYLPEMSKDLTDLKLKIILGHQPITAWDSQIEKLKSDPKMEQFTKEINEAYQSRTGN